MPEGPGKYDDIATMARELTQARGVILIILEGHLGFGFECQLNLEDTLMIPATLRNIADQIEKDSKHLLQGEKS